MEYYYVDGEIREDWTGGKVIGFYDNGEIHEEWRGGRQLGFV